MYDMQSKISTFFKSSSSFDTVTKSPLTDDGADELDVWEKKQHQFSNTYTRRTPNPNSVEKKDNVEKIRLLDKKSPEPIVAAMVMNKKQSYAQFHLEFGQSDFLLHSCFTCGIKYVAGDAKDEKIHKSFHKDYTHGIQFKGWSNERVVRLPGIEDTGGRIVMVLDCDSHSHKNKVEQVVKMMEIELGSGWIFNSMCKVFLFVLSQRVVGCAVAEPIEKAFRVVSVLANRKSEATKVKIERARPNTLQFGAISFQREFAKRTPDGVNANHSEKDLKASIFCDKELVPALCGIRAIWVSPVNRRNCIATKLLDAVRKSFCSEFVTERSQLAFSQPTFSGRALASSYIGGDSFLVYKSKQPDMR